MKVSALISSILLLFLFKVDTAFSQQVMQSTAQLKGPVSVNFTNAAAYEVLHPISRHERRIIEQDEDKDAKAERIKGPISNDAARFEVTLLKNNARTVSPAPNISFNGTLDGGSLIPPDVSGTVGNDFVLESNNQELAIYDKSGVLKMKLSYPTFFNSTGGHGYFDPVTAYDPNHKRFIVAIDGMDYNNHGTIFIAVSQTPDPTGSWFVYSFDATGNPDDFFDYPTLGFNYNWVVVSGNNFLTNGGIANDVFVFNRADLFAGSGSTVHTFSVNNDFNITPAVTIDTTTTAQFLVSDWDGYDGGYGYMRIYKISGAEDAPTFSTGNLIGINQPWAENWFYAPQLDNYNVLEAGNTRVSTPTFINGSLWFTHSVYVPYGSPNHSAVDWWQVNPEVNTLLQFGREEDNSGNTYYFYPSLSVNRQNDVLLGYSVSSPNIYPSAQYSFRASSDPLNTMQDGYLFKPGLASYFKDFGSGRNRWGDYSGTATDPADNSFWTFQEFANVPANNWGTVIANVGGIQCNEHPAAGYISSVFPSVCPGEKTVLTLMGYTFGEAGIELQWQESPDGISSWINIQGAEGNASRYETEALFNKTYYRCIVTCSDAGLSDTSNVVHIDVNGFVPVDNTTVCSPGVYDLTANANGTTTWYKTDSSSFPFYTGNTLVANIIGDSTFYVSTSTIDHASCGPVDKSIGSGSYYGAMNEGLVFKAYRNLVLDSFFVYPNSSGTVKVNLINLETGTKVDSVIVNISAAQAHTKTAVHLNMSVTGGDTYQLNATGSNAGGLYRNSAGAVYPYEIADVLSITQAINGSSGYYYYFYDWHISLGCKSDLFPVHVHIDEPVVTAFATPDSICAWHVTNLIGSGAQNYEWQPLNLSNAVVAASPQSTTSYTVTGTDSYGCSGTAQVTVDVTNCNVGIDEVVNESSLSISPNPVDDELHLVFSKSQSPVHEVFIYDMEGREVQRIDLNGCTSCSFSLSQLTAGMYMIKAGKEVQKFAKQ